ncbi:glycosyltransferase [Aerococcus urinaeequi]|uniref:glycosyltransferase n=1 Tax=Aerococcus urinaeequi TaxID=51665 RepID=UPI003D6A7F18
MKYIGFFDLDSNKKEDRTYHYSARNKMLYVTDVLNSINQKVEIISPSWTKNKSFYNGKKISINSDSELILGATIPYIFLISHLWSVLWLTLYLLFNVKKNETIIVYHSLILILPIKLVIFLKKVDVILEIEEIYSLVIEDKKRLRDIEINYLKKMNKRILVSDKLQKYIGQRNDVILYGSYETKINKKMDRECKKMVYAGSIDNQRRAAFNAVELMNYINDSDYKLYILGSGNEVDLKKLINLIEKTNEKLNYTAVKYLGSKSGKEFDMFMNTCTIALNLQDIGNYMETAFPSKILSYFSYGLNVVSTKVENIYNSPFSEHITFVDSENPKEWAKIVQNIIETDPKSVLNLITKYDADFKLSLFDLLKNEN